MSSIITLVVVIGGAYLLWTNKDQILAAIKPVISGGGGGGDTSGGYGSAGGGGGGGASCSSSYSNTGSYKKTGNYIGTPGWYTISGHHHCNKGEAGCVCTDPKKCLGKSGTGSENCRNGECAPCAGECRPDLGRYGATPCSDCPAGTGGGACAGGGGGGGSSYKAPSKGKGKAKKGGYARANYASNMIGYQSDGNNNGGRRIKLGYYTGTMYPNGVIVYDEPSSIALSHERMSFR